MLATPLDEALRKFTYVLSTLFAILCEYGADQNQRQTGGNNLPAEISKTIDAANALVNQINAQVLEPLHSRTRKKLLNTLINLTALISRLLRLANAEEFSKLHDDSTTIPPTLLLTLELTSQYLSVELSYYIKLEEYYSRGHSHGRYEGQSNIVSDKVWPYVELASVFKPTDISDSLFDRVSPISLVGKDHVDASNAIALELQSSNKALCTLVPVFFATDRAIAKDSKPQHAQFMDRRGTESLIYGIAEVSIPPIPVHKRGRIERPFSLWKFQFREDPSKHIVITSCDTNSVRDWQQIAADKLDEIGSKSALVFIHGFNVSFDDAIRQAAQIGRDIEFKGLVAAYSWCSESAIVDYAADEDSVRLTAPRLLGFLEILKNIGITTIHVIAHSMGNRALLEVLESFPTVESEESLLGEIIMAAPDIDASLFKQSVAKLKGKARRYTLYGSASDKAILASKIAHAGYPRAGDGGAFVLVVDGVETIDATPVGKDLLGLGHAYFSKKRPVLSDIYYIIRESLPAARREGLQETLLGTLKYWVFDPH